MNTSSSAAPVKVFTVGLRAKGPNDSHVKKIDRLARAMGMDRFPWKDQLVAVKVHFGERGNSSFMRPTLVRPLVDIVAQGGGKPFLAETATLYTGSRSNAPDHVMTAMAHGFGPEVTGAPVFICDGLTGRNAHHVKIKGKHFSEVSIASGIHEADALVVLSHFKGHEISGFGGAIKNLGMGCGSRAGKLAMHTSIRPSVLEDRCVRCKSCFSWCSVGAIGQADPNGPVTIDHAKCRGCGECLISCRVGAIRINWADDAGKVTERMVEHALGAVEPKRGKMFFVNILTDIVPLCDCYGFSDAPIVPDIGFAASTDPVALDACCVDLVNAQIGLRDSALKGGFEANQPKWQHVHEELDTGIQLNYGEAVGLGTARYERVILD